MTVVEALKIRIENLLRERNITLYRLALNSGMYYGTLMKIISQKNVSANLLTIIQIANGFNMTVWEFLTDPLFAISNFNID
jgi:predicted transcriptional regulator